MTSMPDSVPVTASAALPVLAQPLPVASRITLPEAMPGIEELFLFAREAELRFSALRLVIEEQILSARGQEQLSHELWLRHPGQARVTTRRGRELPSQDYDVWLLVDDLVTTYLAARKVASRRPRQRHVVGFEDPGLPAFARQREPLTALPPGSLLDTFVHPHGLFRNVLVTGPLAVIGTQPVGDREAIVVRAEHPRASEVLVDRPDRSIEVGIDRATGLLLLLTERIADAVTRHAEVSELVVDPVIPDSAFELRLSADVRKLY
jgi:hypothetical protein